ncbi:MAG: helix-turn-helix transcriptional regulator [Candidatus Nanopelagicales bacterium]
MVGYSKAERLLNLLMALRSARYAIDRAAIREKVRGYDQEGSEESFARMFERDKEELRGLGIDVITVTDPGGAVVGYRVDRADRLPELQLAADELAVLAVAVHLWGGTHLGPAARNALGKVEARLGWRVLGAPGLAAQPAAGTIVDDPQLPDLMAGVTARQVVEFSYQRGGVGPERRRRVQPWTVVWWRAGWYLVGKDLRRAQTRVFRINRIVGAIECCGEVGAFEVPADFDARAAVGAFHTDRPGVAVVELADGRGASLHGAGQAVGVPRPGWTTWEIGYRELPMLVAAVAALGPAAVPLTGPEVVSGVCGAWQAVLAAQSRRPARRGRPVPDQPPVPGQVQLARILALVPWLVANDGISVSAAAAHFGIAPEQLRADLGSIITSGRDDWTLFDIQYWDDDAVIRVLDPLDLDSPLKLAPDEAMALLLALEALAAMPGMADPEVLARVRGKLAGSTGTVPDEAVAFRVDIDPAVGKAVEQALRDARFLQLTYLSATKDERTERLVEPLALVTADGYPYLRGYCRRAADVRTFRLDRIIAATLGEAVPAGVIEGRKRQPESLLEATFPVELEISGDARAIMERYRFSSVCELAGGGWRGTLQVAEPQWLISQVLSWGGEVVVREPVQLAHEVTQAARDALAGCRTAAPETI